VSAHTCRQLHAHNIQSSKLHAGSEAKCSQGYQSLMTIHEDHLSGYTHPAYRWAHCNRAAMESLKKGDMGEVVPVGNTRQQLSCMW
jgi:hypothetical protein